MSDRERVWGGEGEEREVGRREGGWERDERGR